MRPWFVAAVCALLSLPTGNAWSQPQDPGQRGKPGTGAPSADASDPRVAQLAQRVEARIREREQLVDGIRVGVAVLDLATGKVIYGRDADGSYNTASNTKIVTTAAALALLGPDFSFQTAVLAGGIETDGSIRGDVYLRGAGDPLMGVADLRSLAGALAQAGVKQIRGGVVIDATYFDNVESPPHFEEQPEEQASFRAPIGAVSVGFNSYTLTVRPAPAAGRPAVITVDPPSAYIAVDAQVETVSRGRSRLRVGHTESPGKLTVSVQGQIRVERGERRYRRRIPDPIAFAGAVFRRALRDEGIRVARTGVRAAAAPPGSVILATHSSAALAALVRGLGKFSNNFMAEMLLKTIGAEDEARRTSPPRPATWADGIRAVERFLVDDIGLKKGSFRYGNGSGLFDSNRFSPRQMVTLLGAAHRDFRWGPDLIASLAIAGADGTLRRRLADTPAERQVRAKTGTLDGVSALAGFAAADPREGLAFAIFVNDFPRRFGSAARALQDDIAVELLRFLETPK